MIFEKRNNYVIGFLKSKTHVHLKQIHGLDKVLELFLLFSILDDNEPVVFKESWLYCLIAKLSWFLSDGVCVCHSCRMNTWRKVVYLIAHDYNLGRYTYYMWFVSMAMYNILYHSIYFSISKWFVKKHGYFISYKMSRNYLQKHGN